MKIRQKKTPNPVDWLDDDYKLYTAPEVQIIVDSFYFPIVDRVYSWFIVTYVFFYHICLSFLNVRIGREYDYMNLGIEGRIKMPEISRFYGIIIKMLYNDNDKHHKPHVHVYYGEYEASMSLDGDVLE